MQPAPTPAAHPGARLALTMLIAINLFNYIDRQVLAAVLPKVRADLALSASQAGWLASAFLLSYMLISPVFGWLGDRVPRWWLVGVGVIVWSLASGASGHARPMQVAGFAFSGFAVMLATRALIGIGEGAYGPVAPSLIADMYPVARRGAVLAWFYVAIPVGGALGFVIGGLIAGRFGWPWAFYAVMPPGILLGVICFFLREPPRGGADEVAHRHATLADYLGLFRIRSYVWNTLGMTAFTFAIGAVALLIPTYYYDRDAVFSLTPRVVDRLRAEADGQPFALDPKLDPEDTPGAAPVPRAVVDGLRLTLGKEYRGIDEFRTALAWDLDPAQVVSHRAAIAHKARVLDKSVSLEQVNIMFGGVVVISGLGATLLGGWLGDRFRNRVPGAYALVCGVGMLVGFPFFLLALEVPFPWAWLFIFLAVFCLFLNTGPSNTILANVTHPSIRSSAFALNILLIHLFGDVASPPLVGLIDDARSLRLGMFAVSGAILLSGVFWIWAARYLERDTALAPTRIGGEP